MWPYTCWPLRAGELDQSVGRGPVVDAGGRLQPGPLHRVFGGELPNSRATIAAYGGSLQAHPCSPRSRAGSRTAARASRSAGAGASAGHAVDSALGTARPAPWAHRIAPAFDADADASCGPRAAANAERDADGPMRRRPRGKQEPLPPGSACLRPVHRQPAYRRRTSIEIPRSERTTSADVAQSRPTSRRGVGPVDLDERGDRRDVSSCPPDPAGRAGLVGGAGPVGVLDVVAGGFCRRGVLCDGCAAPGVMAWASVFCFCRVARLASRSAIDLYCTKKTLTLLNSQKTRVCSPGSSFGPNWSAAAGTAADRRQPGLGDGGEVAAEPWSGSAPVGPPRKRRQTNR